MRRRALLVFALSGALLCPSLPAAPTAEQARQAQTLIAQLAHRDFAVREAATKKLVAMGHAVLPVLKRMRRTSDDPEVRLRCEQAIAGIQKRLRERGIGERMVKNLGSYPMEHACFPDFSRDGMRAAYPIAMDGVCRVVCDGKGGPAYDGVSYDIMFSADGKHFAYVAKKDEKWFVVIDGVPQARFDEIRVRWVGTGGEIEGHNCEIPGYGLSPDGKHLVYQARRGEHWFVVDRGKEYGPWEEVRDLDGTTDLAHLAWSGKRDGRWCAVRDGLTDATWDEAKEPALSEDGKRFAFCARREDKWFVILDGKPDKAYDAVGKPAFSPDGKHMAFCARKGKKFHLVRDGVESKAWDDVRGPVFSPDGKHLAYRANRGAIDHELDVDRDVAELGGENFLVVDGKPGLPWARVEKEITWSADSRRVAVAVVRGQDHFVVCDGKASGPFGGTGRLVFSPDGRHLAYLAQRVDERDENPDHREFIVCDGRRGPRYDSVSDPVFSPDGRHLLYVAVEEQADRSEFVVCDGIEGMRHPYVFAWWWDPDNIIGVPDPRKSFRFHVVDHDTIHLVEIDWPDDLDWTFAVEAEETEGE